ncbi:MAG: hypothetical protein Sapg2KO_45330 [Saprospiraceae bacterium]
MDRTEINHSASIDITKYGNWLKVDSKFKLRNINLPPSGFTEGNLPLLQKREFENLLDLQIVYKDGLLSAFTSALEVCEIIQEINKEIK